jgi:hypothetical protein
MSSKSFFRDLAQCSRLSFALSRMMLVVVSTIGGAYAFDEIMQSGAVADKWFILLLIAATAVLLVGEQVMRSHMIKKGLRFFEYSTLGENKEKVLQYRNLFEQTWSSIPRIIAGAIYGASVSTAAFFIYERADEPRLGA